MGQLKCYNPYIRYERVIVMYGYIIAAKGYYEVYAADGRFLCSADTKAEAMEELDAWEEELIA